LPYSWCLISYAKWHYCTEIVPIIWPVLNTIMVVLNENYEYIISEHVTYCFPGLLASFSIYAPSAFVSELHPVSIYQFSCCSDGIKTVVQDQDRNSNIQNQDREQNIKSQDQDAGFHDEDETKTTLCLEDKQQTII